MSARGWAGVVRPTAATKRAALGIARTMSVPERYQDAAFEWREGYAHGLAGSSRANPVRPMTARVGDVEYEDYLFRHEAWGAGRDAGRRARKKAAATQPETAQ